MLRNRPAQSRGMLARQLAVVLFSFLMGQIVSVLLIPSSAGFWVHLLVFLAVYIAVYTALFRLLTNMNRRRGPMDGPADPDSA